MSKFEVIISNYCTHSLLGTYAYERMSFCYQKHSVLSDTISRTSTQMNFDLHLHFQTSTSWHGLVP